MSVWIVSKADMDAFVTIALRWTERGDVAGLPEPAASVLNVTRENASEVGSRLWLANHNAFNYGGPPEMADPELLAELEADGEEIVEMPAYEFEEFPGTPAPETAVKRAEYYSYQTAGDYWEDGQAPFESLFTISMKWYGLVLLGRADASRVPRSAFDEGAVDLSGTPRYEQSGWQLSESDRDLFLRIT